jgi:hypothetical protein
MEGSAMCAKSSKKSVTAPQQPLSLDEKTADIKTAEQTADTKVEQVDWDLKAKELYDALGEKEQSYAKTYWGLGQALRMLQTQHVIKGWNDLLAYANDKLGMDSRSKVTRALRIFDQHKTVEEVTGKSINAACGYRCEDEPKPEEPKSGEKLPYLSPMLTHREHRTAHRYVEAMGSYERAGEVLVRVFVNHEQPVKSGKKKPEKTWVAAWEEIRDNRDEVRKSGELNDAWMSLPETDRALPSYKETKADSVGSLERFRSIRTKCLNIVEEQHLKVAAGYHAKAVEIVGAVQQVVNEALDIPPAIEQPAIEQSAIEQPAAALSAN